MASHGTDQLLVQRLLGCKSKRDSQKALMLDATLIVLQFAFFLFLGLCLFAFYKGIPFEQLTLSQTGLNLTSSDEIFPKFIVENLPSGLSGLVIAGVLASAMGTLSSAISSLASSTFLDLFKLTSKGKKLKQDKEVRWSKIFTLFWGVVLVGGAMLFRDSKNPVVEIGLTIASITYGGLLGTFLLGIFFKYTDQRDAIFGFIAGMLVMVLVVYGTKIAYTWYTIIGVIVTLLVANAAHYIYKLIRKPEIE
jgi:Na+/proline symporter